MLIESAKKSTLLWPGQQVPQSPAKRSSGRREWSASLCQLRTPISLMRLDFAGRHEPQQIYAKKTLLRSGCQDI